MTDKYIDFDAYRREKKKEPIIVKCFGEELKMPASPRLAVMEELIELKNKIGSEGLISEEQTVFMIKALLGEEQAEKLSEKGITIDELEWLLTQIWQQYSPDKDDSKKGETSISQKGGPVSKQISRENTG